MNRKDTKQAIFPGMELPQLAAIEPKTNSRKSKLTIRADVLPDKLGKAIKLPVPDFSDPSRKLTCLEADFPIANINSLAIPEATSPGVRRRPEYNSFKWFARRGPSLFRSLLISAATECPDKREWAAKLVWDSFYVNHQRAKSFQNLRVLDCFMGGGTTLIEGSRLGMKMTGVDLNPVAWFVVRNELACSDPEQVKSLFQHVEQQVNPQIQPFYTTRCPRGHRGRWIDVVSGEQVNIDPIHLPYENRLRYRWEGPEIIYTFWAKHGPCQAKGCGHRTPIVWTPLIAEKKLSTDYLSLDCPKCRINFHAELGETRMAPGTERVILKGEHPFTELAQDFARLLIDYDKGSSDDTSQRARTLRSQVYDERGLHCPQCGTYSGKRLADVTERHCQPTIRANQRKKKAFGIKPKPIQMFLLIHPDWLKGAPGLDGEKELGGWSGASPDSSSAWYESRLEKLSLVELRGEELPEKVQLFDGTVIETGKGTVPVKAHFSCGSCGLGGKDKLSDKNNNTLEAVRQSGHTAPIATYALQCHCPQCENEGYNYRGRYFKAPDREDIERLSIAEEEWSVRSKSDLDSFWPKAELWVSYMTHKLNGGIPNWGYTHWWKMFNSRQLLLHSQLLKTITEAGETWPLDVCEQALGGIQQYLRNQCMFAFWHIANDVPVPHLSNDNYHPKNTTVENNFCGRLGYGNWRSCSSGVIDGLNSVRNPWESFVIEGQTRAERVYPGDPVIPNLADIYCGSSTDLSIIGNELFDLVITDPPFGNNVFYADLADFFYVWLRIPLCKWYKGLPEEAYFLPVRTPHSLEAVDNSVEHPDDREAYEKDPFIEAKHIVQVRERTGDSALNENDPNPLHRPQPSSDFYRQTLSAVWTEAGRRLKDAGIMAFTFHHNEDQAWIDILKALFDAGYLLVATYPIRSDDSKGEGANAAFGSKKIEYDIVHVCRKRLEAVEPVSWARMRRWVKEETTRLKNLLEHTHGKTLPESDLRVILRGKSLEFYSSHYGAVLTGDGQVLNVRDALLGINQLLDDILEDTTKTAGLRAPDAAEPASRFYLRLFYNRTEMDRDELHKTLRGTGFAQGDLEAQGWIRVVGRAVHVVPIEERFAFFTERGRNRKVIKTDLDQAHFLIGAALPNSGLKIDVELNNPNFRIKRSADDILKWYAEVDTNPTHRMASRTAAQLLDHWRTRKDKPREEQLTLFELLEEKA